MIDAHGRPITYLRVSVTDRCDLRCTYCMSPDHRFVPRPEILTLEEIERTCRAFVALGVRKIRITGGEPLVRRDVMQLFRSLGGLVAPNQLDEVTLTTNGTQLARFAQDLAACGVRRVNVSLDSLDPFRFRAITGRDALHDVLNGIAAARWAGLRVKVNAVAMGDGIDEEFDRLLAWCGEQGHDLTLIEAMPMGRMDHPGPSLSEVERRLRERWTLIPSLERTGGPARYVTVAETGRRLGFITPLSDSFCNSCNRVRLSCEGQLRLCLARGEHLDLRSLLRGGADDAALREAVLTAIRGKPRTHDFLQPRRVASGHGMNTIGG